MATKPNSERQPQKWSRAPPRSGEKPGAAAIAIIISAMARPRAAPLKRSRAIARDSTEVEHAPAAWIIRPIRRLASVLELAHQMLPATNTAKPARTGQRLP